MNISCVPNFLIGGERWMQEKEKPDSFQHGGSIQMKPGEARLL